MSYIINLFISKLMSGGEREKAEKILLSSLHLLHPRINHITDSVPHALYLPLIEAVFIAKPLVEVRSKRLSGATYRVPVEISILRQYSLSISWIIQHARKRRDPSMALRLAREIDDIRSFNPANQTLKKRDELHRIAESNRAFSYLRDLTKKNV